MTTDFIELSATHDASEGSTELQISFSCGAFSGQGSAYFDAKRLSANAEAAGLFPLSRDNAVCIEGGYLDSARPGVVRERHLSLRFVAGQISPVELQVGAGVPWVHKPGLRHWSEATFLIDYEQVRAISTALLKLARGEKTSARIELKTYR
jgi:hypothetical protein